MVMFYMYFSLNKDIYLSIYEVEPDGTEVELASTFRVIVLRTAKMELSRKNY